MAGGTGGATLALPSARREASGGTGRSPGAGGGTHGIDKALAVSGEARVRGGRSWGPAARTLCVVTVALAGCSPHLGGFTATYANDSGLSLSATPPAGDGFGFRIARAGTDAKGRRLYPRPGRALLKLSGYLPVGPESVEETADAFVVRFALPEDALAAAKTGSRGSTYFEGELMLPYDTGVSSFAGVERHAPGVAHMRVRLAPDDVGPFPRVAESVGEFFRGLYAAR